MAGVLKEQVLQAVKTVESLYSKLVLVVGQSCTGKTAIMHLLAGHFKTPLINVNLVLSRLLLDQTPRQRVLHFPDLLADLADRSTEPVLLDNIEIIFDKNLKQDPLRLLQNIARRHIVVAAWPGEIKSGRLTYAEPSHQEYRIYDLADLVTVQLAAKHSFND